MNPTVIKSFKGLLWDNYVEEISYSFHQNSISNTISENKKILSSFFLIQNSQQYYERHYQKITDVFSSMGCIGSAVFMIPTIK